MFREATTDLALRPLERFARATRAAAEELAAPEPPRQKKKKPKGQGKDKKKPKKKGDGIKGNDAAKKKRPRRRDS